VTLAGGLTEESDPGSVNLAARLVDGQQLVVGSKGQPIAEPRAGGKLNLNAATLADLDALPGVGPVLAQRIIERRQRLGPFERIEQLRDERILPNATYERIKELISVS
jgi:competence protein ComEA